MGVMVLLNYELSTEMVVYDHMTNATTNGESRLTLLGSLSLFRFYEAFLFIIPKNFFHTYQLLHPL